MLEILPQTNSHSPVLPNHNVVVSILIGSIYCKINDVLICTSEHYKQQLTITIILKTVFLLTK